MATLPHAIQPTRRPGKINKARAEDLGLEPVRLRLVLRSADLRVANRAKRYRNVRNDVEV